MELTLLCIGDVVGPPGRVIVARALPGLVRQHAVDCVIANVENIAGGSGLTAPLYDKLCKYGVHLMTLGDHIYRRPDILPVLARSERIVRPANFPREAVGREWGVFQTRRGPSVAVVSLMGRLFMKQPVDCPFHAVERVLAELPREVRVIVVDVHGESNGEKVAMGWHLDGRVSAVVGTHTHIPTADERLLPRGTAYITDLGMTGPYASVLGRRTDRVTQNLITGMPTVFEVATDDVRLCGLLVRVDSETGKATHVERVRVDAPPAGADADDADE